LLIRKTAKGFNDSLSNNIEIHPGFEAFGVATKRDSPDAKEKKEAGTQHVRKKFDDGWYEGEVIEYDSKEKFYKIQHTQMVTRREFDVKDMQRCAKHKQHCAKRKARGQQN